MVEFGFSTCKFCNYLQFCFVMLKRVRVESDIRFSVEIRIGLGDD